MQPATPNVASARGHPREASSSAASDAGGSLMDVDPEIEVYYSGKSDSPSYSLSPARSSGKDAGAVTRTAKSRGILDP